MSVKYTFIKGVCCLLHMQSLMAMPYDKLQKLFKIAQAKPKIPRLSDSKLDCFVVKVEHCSVLMIRHKQTVGQVCIYITGGGMLKYPKPEQAREALSLAKKLGQDMVLSYYPLVPDHNLYDV